MNRPGMTKANLNMLLDVVFRERDEAIAKATQLSAKMERVRTYLTQLGTDEPFRVDLLRVIDE